MWATEENECLGTNVGGHFCWSKDPVYGGCRGICVEKQGKWALVSN